MKLNIKDFEKLYPELLGYTRNKLLKANKGESYTKDILQDLYIYFIDKEFNDFFHLKRSLYNKIGYFITDIFRGKTKYPWCEDATDDLTLQLIDTRVSSNKGYEDVYIESELDRIPGKYGICLKYLYQGYTEDEIKRKGYYCADDYIEEGKKKLMKIEELREHLIKLQRYDLDDLTIFIKDVAQKKPGFIRVRPNGCDGVQDSSKYTRDQLKEALKVWQVEYIDMEYEESLEKHKKNGKPE